MINAEFLGGQCKSEDKSLAEMRRESPEGKALSLAKSLRNHSVYAEAIRGRIPFDQFKRTRAFLLPYGVIAIDTPGHWWATTSEASFLRVWRGVLNGNRRHLWKKP